MPVGTFLRSGLTVWEQESPHFREGRKSITDIREQAQSNNQHHHITGFLLFKDGKFLQYIEGQKAVCEQLFNTIKQDRRHKEIVVLDQGQLEKRYYQQWLMNCYNMDEKTQN